MCYSARIQADYRTYVRRFGAAVNLDEFVALFWSRFDPDRSTSAAAKVYIPRAMESAFDAAQTDQSLAIRRSIDGYRAFETERLQRELFAQRTRLANAERALTQKPTKSAAESARIAADKVERIKAKLVQLGAAALRPADSRIYPGWYAPVLVVENGRRVVKPMRYQCRPAGKPAAYDTRYPGTYNARRDNLTGFWKEQFGHTHGVVLASAFYENVNRHRAEGRELAPGEAVENVVLEFNPRGASEMLLACLWSHWRGAGDQSLLSFALITDEPPPEVAAAGHDRCVIPIEPDNLDAWLNLAATRLDEQTRILDQRQALYYEHRLAA